MAFFEVTTFDDYLRMLRTFCDITGRDDLYDKNGQAVADSIEGIKAKVPAGEEPSVLSDDHVLGRYPRAEFIDA